MATQYLEGDINPTVAPVATATAVEVGDIMAANATTGEVYGAAAQTWNTNEATTRVDFAALFCGVSMQKKTAAVARVHGNSVDNRIGVAMGQATYLVDCVSGNYVYGQWLGPAKDTGNNLLSNTLKVVTAANEATHLCVEGGTSITKVKCKMQLPTKLT
jgi:hypothetical protein